MRRAEEVVIVEKIRGGQIRSRRGVDPSERVGGGAEEAMQEQEEWLVHSNKTGGSPAGAFKQTLSAEEMQDQLEQLTNLMQQKFLSGGHSEHMVYSQIDNGDNLFSPSCRRQVSFKVKKVRRLG
ncbi:hypothetical protein ABZP36_022063 [Zizania latifolia]